MNNSGDVSDAGCHDKMPRQACKVEIARRPNANLAVCMISQTRQRKCVQHSNCPGINILNSNHQCTMLLVAPRTRGLKGLAPPGLPSVPPAKGTLNQAIRAKWRVKRGVGEASMKTTARSPNNRANPPFVFVFRPGAFFQYCGTAIWILSSARHARLCSLWDTKCTTKMVMGVRRTPRRLSSND